MPLRPDKAHVLDVLLKTQQMCLDLFDEFDSEHVVVDRALIARLNDVTNQIAAVRDGFVQHYVLSGNAGTDMLDEIRRSFKQAGDRK